MVGTLEPTKNTGSLARYDPADLLRWYRQMVTIRRFEEKVNEMYTRAKIGGYCHLNIGEEAAVVGAFAAIEAKDYIFTSYRDHGHALARGVDPKAVMAELFGKVGGVTHGRGGSMHMFDPGRGFMGGWAIVGGHLPIAVGAAMALNYRNSDAVVICFLGEGATNIGAFGESLNAAKLWRLPVVFIVLNNGYGMGTPVHKASAVAEQYKKGASYGIEGEQADGMDVLAVYEATGRAIERTRKEREPSLLELVAYRFRGHSVIDPARYRPEAEVEEWMRRDPVLLFHDTLAEAKLLNKEAAEAMERDVERLVEECVAYAEASPDPDVATLFDYLYVEEGGR